MTTGEVIALIKAFSGGGSSGGVLHAVMSGSTATLDKTWQEIFDGDYVAVSVQSDTVKNVLRITSVSHEASYSVATDDGTNVIDFESDSASGYPSATRG